MGDSSASLVLSDPFTLETKPHGHGDVHHLLLREGVAEKLKEDGFEWLFFFQDTNALVSQVFFCRRWGRAGCFFGGLRLSLCRAFSLFSLHRVARESF